MKVTRRLGVALLVAAIGIVAPGVAAQSGRSLVVRVEGSLLPHSRVVAIVINESLTEAPTAAIALRAGSAPPQAGRGIDIARVDGEILFQGEVTAFEQLVQSSGEPTIIVRAFDRLHRLHRGKKTREWSSASDADIARQLALSAGLRAEA